MPPPVERDPNHWRPSSRPWLRDGVVRRVSPHYDEVDTSRGVILPLLLVLVILTLAVVAFLLLRPGVGPVTGVNTPPAIGISSPVPILAMPSLSPSPTVAIVKYKVQAGDTLSGIAAKYGISVQSLMAANKLTSNLIHAGDELFIPSAQ